MAETATAAVKPQAAPTKKKALKEKDLREFAHKVYAKFNAEYQKISADMALTRRMQGLIGTGGTAMEDSDIQAKLEEFVKRYDLDV